MRQVIAGIVGAGLIAVGLLASAFEDGDAKQARPACAVLEMQAAEVGALTADQATGNKLVEKAAHNLQIARAVVGNPDLLPATYYVAAQQFATLAAGYPDTAADLSALGFVESVDDDSMIYPHR